MVHRAQLSTPLLSICSSHEAARGPTETSPETMPPSTVSVRTRAGCRAASRSAIGQADLGRADMEAVDAERVRERQEIVDDALDRPAVVERHRRRPAEAAHVGPHDPEAPGHQRHPGVPCLAALGIAVQQQQRLGRCARNPRSLVAIVHLEVGRDAGGGMVSLLSPAGCRQLRITSPHFLTSSRINLAKVWGSVGAGSAPCSASFWRTSGSARMARSSWFSFCTIGCGVAAGARMPFQPSTS